MLFSQFEFDAYISLSNSKAFPLVYDNGARALDELRMRVERKINYLGRKYPHADLAIVREKYRELGLKPDNVYFFIRGHNLYDLISDRKSVV